MSTKGKIFSEETRRKMSEAHQKQIPGESWTFPCGHKAVLPKKRAESNEFAYWNTKTWICNPCSKARKTKGLRGEGRGGLLTRMAQLHRATEYLSKKSGYAPPNVSPERMTEMWPLQKDLCAACGEPIELLKSDFDHNHDTGEPRGFIHHSCNVVEGNTKRMPKQAILRLATYCINSSKKWDTKKVYSYTLGNLIDVLTVANIRIWMAEDQKRSPNATDKQLADATRVTNAANQQRNDLIQAIDEGMNEIASGQLQKLYKQGSSKLYGRAKKD
jgi:hypothetical protein